MECQPQNPEFRNNPENFHPWPRHQLSLISLSCPHLESLGP